MNNSVENFRPVVAPTFDGFSTKQATANVHIADIAGQQAAEGKHMDYGITKLGARTYTDNPARGSGFYYRGKLFCQLPTLDDRK